MASPPLERLAGPELLTPAWNVGGVQSKGTSRTACASALATGLAATLAVVASGGCAQSSAGGSGNETEATETEGGSGSGPGDGDPMDPPYGTTGGGDTTGGDGDTGSGTDTGSDTGSDPDSAPAIPPRDHGPVIAEEITYDFWCGANEGGPEAATAWCNDKACVVLEAEVPSDRDATAMEDIVRFYAWLHDAFEEVTGLTSLPLDTPYDGRIVMQVPLSNCGAGGLANHGTTGMSVGVPLFNNQHRLSLAGENAYLQVIFYETNRNYWDGFNPYIDWAMNDEPENYGWWTVGMNNAMAFIMPDLMGIELDYYGQDLKKWHDNMVESLYIYMGDEQYDFDYGWRQSLMPWEPDQSINNLMTGLIIASYENGGREAWIKGFFEHIDSVPERPDVFAYQECRNNVYTIWSRAAGEDLRSFFTDSLRWTITAGDPL